MESRSFFSSREELSKAGIHVNRQSGIDWNNTSGASSVVISGGYEDDEDFDNKSSDVSSSSHSDSDDEEVKKLIQTLKFSLGMQNGTTVKMNTMYTFPVKAH